jgi:radical SAM protein (TIGR01212 family)
VGGCIYCNKTGSGTGAFKAGLSIRQQLIQGKGFLKRRYKAEKFLAYFQSFSNTYAPLEQLRRMYEEALAVEDIVGLCIGTRPDCVDESILALLEGYVSDYLVWVEYGLQSIHDDTLNRINRGHTYQDFLQAVEMTKGRGINICTHIILGLPGEDRHKMLGTAKALSTLDIQGVKIHLLYVLKGTKMERMYRHGEYRCLEQDQYTDLVCEFLEVLPPRMVIQRLTGDPDPAELVAPTWALRKRETLTLIDRKMEEMDIWQGKRFGAEGVG